MASGALSQWRSGRASRLDNLLGAHIAVGGSGAGRRRATEELNHALVLRLASEFQGFCRDLHDEAVGGLVQAVAPADPALQELLSIPYRTGRRLDRGNAEPGGLGHDFSMLGMTLWPDIRARYPCRGEEWRTKLALLNEIRNGLAHDDINRIARSRAVGWPPTLRSIRRWRNALDGLASAMDHVTDRYLQHVLNARPW
jgi:hypothetical protein